MAVEPHPGDARQTLQQLPAELDLMVPHGGHPLIQEELGPGPQAGDPGSSGGPGLMAVRKERRHFQFRGKAARAPEDGGAKLEAGCDVEDAHALGAQETLVPGTGEQVDARPVDIQRHRAGRLGGVHQDGHAAAMGEFQDILQRETPTTAQQHRQTVDDLKKKYNVLVPAQKKALISALEKEMLELAKNLEFENAALVRDEIQKLKTNQS